MRYLFVLVALVATLMTGSAVAQTLTAPQTQTTPQIQTVPKLKVLPNLPNLAVGKRVVRGLDFAAEGLPLPAASREDSKVVRKVEETHSALILYGTINMGDIEYFSVSPGFQTQYQMFSDRPQGCQIDVVTLQQGRESRWNFGYKIIYRFWDTATKKECGDYFRNLKTVTLDLQDLRVKYVSVWQQPQSYPVANPGSRTIPMPAIQPRDPSGDE